MASVFPTFDKAINDLSDFRIWREGWALPASTGFGYFKSASVDTTGQQFNMIDIGTGFNGFMCIADGITLYTNQPLYLQLISNTYPSGDSTIMTRNPGFDYRELVVGNITIPAKFIFEGQKQIRVNILEEDTGAGIHKTNVLVTANLINVRRLTLSQLNRSDKVIYWVGDSITGLTSVGTRKFLADNFHIYQVENAINTAYVNAGLSLSTRTVNKAIGGQTSFDFQKYIMNRVADIDQADLILFAYGTNEAINNVLPSDFAIYINSAWEWFKRKYPQSHMVLVGATPLNDNTNNNRLIAHRAVMSNFVTTIADPRLTYVSMENAFDRTILSNYTSNDGVHPGTQACFDSMASIIYTHILADNDARRALNLPLI